MCTRCLDIPHPSGILRARVHGLNRALRRECQPSSPPSLNTHSHQLHTLLGLLRARVHGFQRALRRERQPGQRGAGAAQGGNRRGAGQGGGQAVGLPIAHRLCIWYLHQLLCIWFLQGDFDYIHNRRGAGKRVSQRPRLHAAQYSLHTALGGVPTHTYERN